MTDRQEWRARCRWTRTCVSCKSTFEARSPLTKWCENCQDAKAEYRRAYVHERAVLNWKDPDKRAADEAYHRRPERRAKAVELCREYLKAPDVRARVMSYQQKYRDAHKADHAAYVQTPEYKAKRREYISNHPEMWGNFWVDSGPTAEVLARWSEFVGFELD